MSGLPFAAQRRISFEAKLMKADAVVVSRA